MKQILDRDRCKSLREGDILVEINGDRIKELDHHKVVQKLKEFPIDQEVSILIQRSKRELHLI